MKKIYLLSFFTALHLAGFIIKKYHIDDEVVAADEPFRPAYHFTPPLNWCNDPNGMVYYAGEYHLFYQHNPYGTKWGNMSWGHAISRDLVNWEHLPIALYPDSLGTIFSGSAVVDENNTAGFQTGDEKTLLAFYTNAEKQGQIQSLAYSVDKGRTWKKYDQNPILRHNPDTPDFRDPKVFWFSPENKWVMILAVQDVVEIYSSPDAKKWTYESNFGAGFGNHDGVWECPDLFEIDGKWVLLVNNFHKDENSGSATQYFVGNFDGKTFSCEYPAQNEGANRLDRGKDHYATVTWANVPDNRKIALSWMGNVEYANDLPTQNFRNAMSVPRELTLVKENDKYLLKAAPVREIEKLHRKKTSFPFILAENKYTIENLPASGAYELLVDIERQSAQRFGFALKNSRNEETVITVDAEKNLFSVNRANSGIVDFNDKFPAETIAPISVKNKYHLQVLVDKCSIECFLDGGEVSMTNLVFPNEPYSVIEFFGEKGKFKINNLQVIELRQDEKNK
jgi:fructan beta-fructosidase